MDQYTILSTIARTATSQVLMVTHKTSGKQYAIKQLIIPERLEEELYSSMQGDLVVVPNEYYSDSDSEDESDEKPNEIHLPISIQTENTNIQIPTSFIAVVDHGDSKKTSPRLNISSKVSNNSISINTLGGLGGGINGGLLSSTMLTSSKVNSGSFKKNSSTTQKLPTPTLSPRIDSSVNKQMFNLSIQGVSPSSPVSKTHKQPTIVMVNSDSDDSDNEDKNYNHVKPSLQAEIKAKQEMKYIQNEIQTLKMLEKGPNYESGNNQFCKVQVSVEDKVPEFKKHICLMKEVIEEPDEGKLCLVLEYANGGDLFSIIEHYDESTPLGHMKEEQARFYFQQILYGILYMHRCGVCHRDLKPENILVVEETNSTPLLKISDFGFSGILKKQDKTFTDLVGTESWCAPEILNREPYDGRKADVWSLGCILYALLTGCFAFDHDDPHELLKLIQKVQVQFPPYISKDTKEFILGMICHSPTRRLTIEQVVDHAWMKKPSYL